MNTSTLYHKRNYFIIREILNLYLVLICLSSGIALADVLDAGDYQTCGITTANNDNISCWGDNPAGAIPSPITASQVSIGMSHICVITQEGQMNCWGDNTTDQAPASEVGPFIQVSAGDFHTCALTSSGDIKCWGDNFDGQAPTLETGPFQQVSAGSAHTCALTTVGQVKCWGNNEYEQAPSEPVAGTFTQISASGYHTCGLTSNNEMTCWGDITLSEVGPFSHISTGFAHTCAIKASSGEIQCWGDDMHGEVSLPSQAGGNFVEVSVGFDHTCAVKESGNVSCWGDDSYNQIDVPADLVLNVSITGDTDTPPSETDNTPPSETDNTPPSGTDTPPSGTDTPPSGTDTPPVNGTAPCEPATYSNETRQVTNLSIEIPLYTDVDGKSILFTGLFSAILEIPFGFSDIQVKELTFIETIEQTNSCHAQFSPENGLLTIPFLTVPTIIPSLTNNPISGPNVQCDATLQQSILRPDVLSLIDFNCNLP